MAPTLGCMLDLAWTKYAEAGAARSTVPKQALCAAWSRSSDLGLHRTALQVAPILATPGHVLESI